MVTKRAFVSAALIAAVGVTGVGAAWAAVTAGTAAPDLSLIDAKGQAVSLAAFRGKTVVIEWTNPECPYVRKHYDSGNMQALQRDVTGAGAVWLTISSAAKGNVGYLEDLDAQAFMDDRKSAPTAFLFDRDGAVMERYGVQVALSMYVVDAKGMLAYAGAIDDRPTAKPEDVKGARNYVREAVAAVARGELPKPAQTRAYGCVAR